MTTSRANEPVHPYEVVEHYFGGGRAERRVPGITLREHFAAMAMQGLLAAGTARDINASDNDFAYLAAKSIARKALMVADTLIAELAIPVKP